MHVAMQMNLPVTMYAAMQVDGVMSVSLCSSEVVGSMCVMIFFIKKHTTLDGSLV